MYIACLSMGPSERMAINVMFDTIHVLNSICNLQLYHLVLAAGGHTGAIGRPVYAKHFVRMSRQLLRQLLALHAPNCNWIEI